jgi:hypothetical protein
MELRWKQNDVNPFTMTLEYYDNGSWKPVPMVDCHEQPLAEHPNETQRRKRAREKKLKKIVEEMKQKKLTAGK